MLSTALQPGNRVVVWFSCGAASAVAAKLATEKYGDRCVIAYCDTSINEHPDNIRFLTDIEQWIGKPILRLRNKKYTDIYDVFDKEKWLVGPKGAKCTMLLKKKVRQKFTKPGDIEIFGYTLEEATKKTQSGLTRVLDFEGNNPEVIVEWILVDNEISKSNCYSILQEASITLPAMYLLGYNNNNCIGCVKGQQGYWNKIRVDFPKTFSRMMMQEIRMGAAINKRYIGTTRHKLFLYELDPQAGRKVPLPDIDCGVVCVGLPT